MAYMRIRSEGLVGCVDLAPFFRQYLYIGNIYINNYSIRYCQVYKFRTPDLIMEIQGLKKIARKLTLTLAP
jgi:hypothetical protein